MPGNLDELDTSTLNEMERKLVLRLLSHERDLIELKKEFKSIKVSMDQNTQSLGEFIDLAKNLKVGMKILGYVESMSVWVTKVAGSLLIMWAGWKFLVKEAIAHINRL